MKRLFIKYWILCLVTTTLSSAFAEMNTLLDCSLKISTPQISRDQKETIHLESQQHASLANSSKRSLLFTDPEITKTYMANVVFLGSVFFENGTEKLKIGIYSLRPSSQRSLKSPYYHFPEGDPHYGYYAHPILESTQKLKAGGIYELSSQRRIGTSDRARATYVQCRS